MLPPQSTDASILSLARAPIALPSAPWPLMPSLRRSIRLGKKNESGQALQTAGRGFLAHSEGVDA